MGYVNINGNPADAVNLDGLPINAVNLNGEALGGTSDYNEYNSDFEKAILDARNLWSAEYREDESIVPLLLQTDEHRHYYASNKPTFDYLGKAIKWGEVSSNINLGDTCGAIYNLTDLNAMVTTLSAIPKNRQIHVVGNHDVWATKKDGSAYSYSITDQFDTLTSQYFEHSAWSDKYVYDNRGNVSVYDHNHKVKYCILGCWYYGNTDTEENQPYHSHRIPTDCMNYWLDMLSEVTDHDLIVLSHIQPLNGTYNLTYPQVDGNAERTESTRLAGNSTLAFSFDLGQLISDRKNKRAGSITDADGIVHNYDFTKCTSDILCWLSGHSHVDYNTIVDGVPVIVFDAYGYDAEPFFMVNVRRNGSVNVWKIGEDTNVYNFEVR